MTIYKHPKELQKVTYTINDGGKATLVNPVEFPSAGTITVTEGTVTNTYTIDFSASEMLKNLKVADENALAPVYLKEGLAVGRDAYSDRSYFINDVTDQRYVGADMIQACMGWYSNATFKSEVLTPWITFTPERDVTVTVFTATNKVNNALLTDGFSLEESSNEKGFVYSELNNNQVRKFKWALTKEFKAGEKYTVINTFYDGSDKLIDVVLRNSATTKDTQQSFKIELDEIPENTCKVRGFVWQNLIPIAKSSLSEGEVTQ